MRTTFAFLILLALACVGVGFSSGQPAGADLDYETYFTDACLRVDLAHTATAATETVGLDGIAREAVWPGSRKRLVDPFDYGKYRFRVRDLAGGRLIFSQGFCSLLGEWQSTEEAKRVSRTMGESLRFPFPRSAVSVALDSRDPQGKFHEIFSVEIDPGSTQISTEQPFGQLEVVDLGVKGNPDRQVDLLILPDGYDRDQIEKMRADAKRFAAILFAAEPWRSHAARFSVRLLEAISGQSGPDEPRKGVFRDTLFETTFNTFDAERYLTTAANRTLRQAASRAPYDVIVIMVNTARYGGGGIYNQWVVFPADNEYDDYVLLHELGHAFAGLGDEYFQAGAGYDEDEFYPPGVEPWEPNLSAFLGGGKAGVKWGALIPADTPLPTPGDEAWKDRVGLFEGAGYKAQGLYRPSLDCKMFHKGLVPYCPVCRESIVRMIRYYTGE